MRVGWVDDISDSYALTLAEWRRRFAGSEEQLEALGYDRRFRRLWDFWLAFSEAGFRERRIRDLQMLIEKPGASPAVDLPAGVPVGAEV